jgi:hypothetical protein
MMAKLCIVIFIISFSSVLPQQFILKGKVSDNNSNEPLSYVNIRITGTTIGTAANINGNYELKLKPDQYKIIASYIGYKSDTVSINLNQDMTVDFLLEQMPVRFEEITVLPKGNPALEIIRRAIKFKHTREEKINSYIFKAYTKGLIKTTKDLVAADRSVDLSVGESDTALLKITGIIENESKGYFRKSSYYKDEIIARKQSANAPSSINILTGGRLLQNFYTNDIQFFGRPLVGPISDNAIDYYYFIIEDTLALDNKNVFQIGFEPIDKSDPGFYGKLFIADSIFALVKLDVNLNDAANPGRLFDKVNIFQQYVPFSDNILMPIDYRLFVEGNFLGIAKFGFELNSVFYDYKINEPIEDDIFDMAVVKVLPDADKKDSTFWKSTQTIPNTLEEMNAYRRIDSLESVPRTFWDNFSFLATTLDFNDNYSITGPLGLYSFNHIEGHTFNLGGQIHNELDKRLNAGLYFSYGLADKRFKTDFSSKYFFGKYRTVSLSINACNKITDLFGESVYYNNLTSSLTSLFGKYDFRDYFYTTGWNAKLSGEVFPILQLGFGVVNRADKNAFHNSDFSILNRSKKYKENKTIYETKINAVSASFTLDFRNFIEDGYRRFRISQNKAYAVLTGEALLSNKSTLKSSLDFNSYQLELSGRIPSYKSSNISFNIKGLYSTGTIPFQVLYALPGIIEGVSKNNSFRTLSLGEIYGDKGFTLNFQHDFNDEFFRLIGLSKILDWQLTLTAHFNVAMMEISDKSKSILQHSFTEFKHPFYELGFGIGQMLLPFSFEFTWRLNYCGKNNFVISINSFAF